MRPYPVIFLLAIVSLISCNKEKPQIDELGPEIQILSPEPQSTFAIGDFITLNIQIEENLGLHGYSVSLIEKETSNYYLIDNKHLHDTFYDLELQYQLPDVPTGAYEILVEASDHDNNISRVTIAINIQ